MTISEALITWLQGYTPNHIDTDIQGAGLATYALAKEPTLLVKNYLSGREEHTEYYQFTARLDSQYDDDRISNGAWLESFESWVESKNKASELPTIDNVDISSVKVTSTFYIGQTNEDNSVYSFTLEIKYIRKGE